MMTLWLHRYMRPTPLASGAVVSVAVHAVLVSSAVLATARAGIEDVPTEPTTIARFLAPPNRLGGQPPQREMIRYVALAVPEGLVNAAAPAVRILDPTAPTVGLDQADAPPMPELIGMDSVFSMVEVDSAASRYEWSAAPAFPPRMLEQNQKIGRAHV